MKSPARLNVVLDFGLNAARVANACLQAYESIWAGFLIAKPNWVSGSQAKLSNVAAKNAITDSHGMLAANRKDLFGGWVSDSQAKLYEWPPTKRLLIEMLYARTFGKICLANGFLIAKPNLMATGHPRERG
jgi:hypothetical protein